MARKMRGNQPPDPDPNQPPYGQQPGQYGPPGQPPQGQPPQYVSGQGQPGQYGPPPGQQYAPPPPVKQKSWPARHKFLTAVGGFVLLVGGCSALLIGGGGGDSASTTAAAPATSAPAARASAPASAAAPASSAAAPASSAAATSSPQAAPAGPGVGDPVRDGKFEFTVTDVKRGLSKVGSENTFNLEQAQGEFVIVSVNVENIGNEPGTLDATGMKLYDAQGREYSTSSAYLSLPNADKTFLQNINPGNKVTKAPLLFDVPKGTKLDRIELHDGLFSGGADVKLAS